MGFFRFFLALGLITTNFLFSQPIVTNLSPAVGATSGGTTVQISGSGFTGTTAVTIGTKSIGFVVNSDNSITISTPAHAPEVLPVTVKAPSGTSAITQNSYFTYQGLWQAYIGDDDGLTVVDTDTNTVTTTVSVGFPQGIALTPDGTEVLASSTGLNVVDTESNSLITSIPLSGIGGIVGTTPDGTQAYVFVGLTQVSAINLTFNTVTTTLTLGSFPYVIAITPDSTKAYVTVFETNSVAVIDTATNTVTTTIPVGNRPGPIVISPDGSLAFVVNTQDVDVTVIDTASNTVTGTVTVGLLSSAIAITPDGTTGYVANGENAIVVFDTTSLTVTDTISLGGSAGLLIITADGTKAYAVFNTEGSPGNVSVIDIATNTVTSTLTIPGDDFLIATTPDGKQVYITSQDNTGNLLIAIDTATDTASQILVGDSPIYLGITPDQAPLARFTVAVGSEGSPTTFDGSNSVSPTGAIANYSWNFGDSSPQVNTPNPIITHVYATSGPFTATLTVTNTAGTSTTQIFNYSADVNNEAAQGMFLSNNGGPTATQSQSLFVMTEPIIVHGKVCKQRFAALTERIKVITWTPSEDPTVVSYLVLRNGILIATIPASDPLIYRDYGRCRRADIYSVIAVNAAGQETVPVSVVLK